MMMIWWSMHDARFFHSFSSWQMQRTPKINRSTMYTWTCIAQTCWMNYMQTINKQNFKAKFRILCSFLCQIGSLLDVKHFFIQTFHKKRFLLLFFINRWPAKTTFDTQLPRWSWRNPNFNDSFFCRPTKRWICMTWR